MESTVNVTFVSSCSAGHPDACLVSKVFFVVELFVVRSLLLHVDTCWVRSGTNNEPSWLDSPTTGTRCMYMFIICSYFLNTYDFNELVFFTIFNTEVTVTVRACFRSIFQYVCGNILNVLNIESPCDMFLFTECN